MRKGMGVEQWRGLGICRDKLRKTKERKLAFKYGILLRGIKRIFRKFSYEVHEIIFPSLLPISFLPSPIKLGFKYICYKDNRKLQTT